MNAILDSTLATRYGCATGEQREVVSVSLKRKCVSSIAILVGTRGTQMARVTRSMGIFGGIATQTVACSQRERKQARQG